MSESKTEVLVGGVVLAVAIGFLVYAGKTTGMTTGGAREYQLSASFRSADGVSVAKTIFTVQEGINVPDDSAVAISSEGLLGGNYVEILPGGSPFPVEPGSEIEFTQGSVSLVSLLMKFVSGGEGETPQ